MECEKQDARVEHPGILFFVGVQTMKLCGRANPASEVVSIPGKNARDAVRQKNAVPRCGIFDLLDHRGFEP